jgi:hypothetical protein
MKLGTSNTRNFRNWCRWLTWLSGKLLQQIQSGENKFYEEEFFSDRFSRIDRILFSAVAARPGARGA